MSLPPSVIEMMKPTLDELWARVANAAALAAAIAGTPSATPDEIQEAQRQLKVARLEWVDAVNAARLAETSEF